VEHIAVPEPQHCEAARFQPGRAPLIALDCLGMLAAIDLDH
jgi:hypothetical protein